MKKLAPGLVAGTAVLAVTTALIAPASAAPPSKDKGTTNAKARPDNRPGPLTKQQNRLRTKALAMLDSNSAKLRERPGGGATVKMPKGPQSVAGGTDDNGATYYEFPAGGKSDEIFTILSQFGGTGPAHNAIAEPDRTQNNSTYWVPDFNQAHYDGMFNADSGESFKNYYEQLSSGRYSATSEVSDWVTVPNNAAYYGANPHEDQGGAWDFITDSANAWYSTAEMSPTEAHDYLSQFDHWDRYDQDGDGNFNEPDGYIDHFQAVHAGEGEEAGGGAQGADAIWSHRWYVNRGFGSTGPTLDDGTQVAYGGTQIGDSGIWIGDYTVEPENGGLGVFAHEFGHDLGLPDYYDTNGGDNSTAFWTLMSSGSWLGHGTDGIGTTPGLMGPQEKLDLGWLDYSEVNHGESATVNLGPAQHTYDDDATAANEADQAVKVNLPDKVTTVNYATPPEGTHAWWTGRADNLNNTLTRSVPAARSVTVTTQAWYSIEAGYDYLYAEYSTDGGDTWTQAGSPIDGDSRGRWTGLRYTYKPGAASLFRFRYQTDGGVNEAGAFLDSIAIKADRTTFTDGAESGDNGWTPDGWSISTGSDTNTTEMYYLMENRQYVGYDATLETGPYNFSEGITRPDWVEFFPYQPGMLVWLVDKAYANNNTSTTPGHGAALPVDARPTPFTYPDGSKPSNRRQPYDATFGVRDVQGICLHKQVMVGKKKKATMETYSACTADGPGMSTFSDSSENAYWSPANPYGSTKLPASGVTATVTNESADHFLTVDVVNP